jgi:hypothetical protein
MEPTRFLVHVDVDTHPSIIRTGSVNRFCAVNSLLRVSPGHGSKPLLSCPAREAEIHSPSNSPTLPEHMNYLRRKGKRIIRKLQLIPSRESPRQGKSLDL